MKKILVFIIMIGVLFLAGCPDGAYLGAMYLKADMGPYSINEVVPMGGLIWMDKENTGSPHSNSALTRAVSSDRGGLSKSSP